MVGEKSVSAAGNITTDGVEILGRMVRSRGRQDDSAPVSITSYQYHLVHCEQCACVFSYLNVQSNHWSWKCDGWPSDREYKKVIKLKEHGEV